MSKVTSFANLKKGISHTKIDSPTLINPDLQPLQIKSSMKINVLDEIRNFKAKHLKQIEATNNQ